MIEKIINLKGKNRFKTKLIDFKQEAPDWKQEMIDLKKNTNCIYKFFTKNKIKNFKNNNLIQIGWNKKSQHVGM